MTPWGQGKQSTATQTGFAAPLLCKCSKLLCTELPVSSPLLGQVKIFLSALSGFQKQCYANCQPQGQGVKQEHKCQSAGSLCIFQARI